MIEGYSGNRRNGENTSISTHGQMIIYKPSYLPGGLMATNLTPLNLA
jgi:hypothetical protein